MVILLFLRERKERFAFVLSVHGGPRHRDKWGYIPEAKWFANRGFACLKINFRGSTDMKRTFYIKVTGSGGIICIMTW
jgi:dipeptidyl aminopeptidase/acylaminoacyl peptidase